MKTNNSPTPAPSTKAPQPTPPPETADNDPVHDPDELAARHAANGGVEDSPGINVTHASNADFLDKRINDLFAAAINLNREGMILEAEERFADIVAELRQSVLGTGNNEHLLAKFLACRLDMEQPPAKPEPRFFLGDVPVSTPGNLTFITSQAKTGKTAFLSAWTAAAIIAEHSLPAADTLGASSTRPRGRCLLRIDTEQSTYDADQVARRILKRAGIDTMPPWIESFCVTGMSPSEIREALPLILEEMNRKHGGIFAVMIDGVADMVTSINDDKECVALLLDLHKFAIRFDCPIIGVVHSNEGSNANSSARGWLGKQGMRKAESNIILKVKDGVTMVYGEQMRGAPIPENKALCFQWSDEHMMHVSCTSPAEEKAKAKKAEKEAELREIAEEVFEGGKKTFSQRKDVISAVMCALGVKERWAQSKCSEMLATGIISNQFMQWRLCKSVQ